MVPCRIARSIPPSAQVDPKRFRSLSASTMGSSAWILGWPGVGIGGPHARSCRTSYYNRVAYDRRTTYDKSTRGERFTLWNKHQDAGAVERVAQARDRHA